MIHPILDEYYVCNPYHCRSSNFAVEKGLVTNEKGTTPRTASPITASGLLPEDFKKHITLPKMQQENIFRNLTPEMHGTLSIRTLPSDQSLRSHAENSGNAILDVRRVMPLPVRDPARPQEQGNTKKKRRSIVATEPVVQAEPEPEHIELSATSERTNYGDPAKIARFFPELNLS
jgi:glutamine amidotransferase